MTKYRLRKNSIYYGGVTLKPGDVIEFDEFDNQLPRGWFEEVVEEPKTEEVIEKPKQKQRRFS